MNVLFVNSIGRKKFGGGEKWMIAAARGLADRGHGVFVAGQSGSRLLDEADRAGLARKAWNVCIDYSPVQVWRMAQFFRSHQIDLLVCNLNKDVRTAGLASRLIGGPVIIARHGVQLCGQRLRHKWTLQHFADGVLTNTASIKGAYDGYGWFSPDFVHVVYNGVEDKSGLRSQDFTMLYPGKKIIFSAGRLSEQKGFSFLIEAALVLKQRRQDLVFVVAGEGRLKEGLVRRIRQAGLEDDFHLIGYQRSIDPLLKGCDLFVLSSLFEGMPNVVMEAMACGKAVVATDVNGVRELMRDGETGRIVPPEDPAALADAIDALVSDPSAMDSYGRAGLDRVRTQFTVTGMIDNLESYFQQKIDKRKGVHAQ